MDRGAWQATVHGVAKSQTRPSDFHFHFGNVRQSCSTVFWYPKQHHWIRASLTSAEVHDTEFNFLLKNIYRKIKKWHVDVRLQCNNSKKSAMRTTKPLQTQGPESRILKPPLFKEKHVTQVTGGRTEMLLVTRGLPTWHVSLKCRCVLFHVSPSLWVTASRSF